MSAKESPPDYLDFTRVFREEREHLCNGSQAAGGDFAAGPKPPPADRPLAALCLSGGGIRSASFAFGLLQTLARHGLLEKFDYLSTVSGGGYIGCFFTAWRKQAGAGIGVPPRFDGVRDSEAREPPEIVGLRNGSNYLTPRLGVLSADTWTALALIIRNLVLNWAIFLPFFMAALLVPWLCRHFLEALRASGCPAWPWLFAGLLALCGGLGCASYGRRRAAGLWLTDGRFVIVALAPTILASMVFTAAAEVQFANTSTGGIAWWIGPGAGAAVYAVAWASGTVGLYLGGHLGAASQECGTSPKEAGAPKRPGSENLLLDLCAWLAAGAVTGEILAYGLGRAASLGAPALTVVGIGWTMLSIFIGELLYVAARSFDARSDMDREWLARAAGWLAAAAVSWSVASGVALFGPAALHAGWTHAVTAVGGISGAVTLLVGGSAKTAATDAAKAAERLNLTQLTSAAGIVFALCLAIGISAVDVTAGRAIALWISPALPTEGLLAQGGFRHAAYDVLGMMALLATSFGVSFCVNINRFSLHGLYRNRLVRTFLGSARLGAKAGRRPDPFTGFDPADNPRMGDVPKSRPLHIINVALNVVSTRNLAWQERRAVAFTVSPLHAGCPLVGYRRVRDFGGKRGGITLGTAMAISGAAVSPNMGYHTSSVLSFLLMLFNVRLGCWLGNPAGQDYGREGPRFGLLTMLQELANQTTADGRWIYLSDGGHFDNLGLYEMLRRRCRTIVVSDAGHDPEATLSDLGDSLRKASIDFGVRVDFELLDPTKSARPPLSSLFCWVGRITYPDCDDEGVLVYFRPTYTGRETADIRSYAEANPMFPHESTSEQWFGERQFEAYRALGAHEAELVCRFELPEDKKLLAPLDAFVEKARIYVRNEPVSALARDLYRELALTSADRAEMP